MLLYLLLRLQGLLPFNPQDMAAVPPDLAVNTAISFITNTNWQTYGGESTMSYLSQMTGLAVQNFLSAATGIALAMALVRGFARANAKGIGNFWADLVRATLYVLLPVCIVLTLFYVWQGVPQNLSAATSRQRRWKAPSRPSPRGRWPRSSPSRCWAPTAAASSTPTRRIPTRTRRRCRTSCRC